MTYQNPPPPPPSSVDTRLSSIKTYILIAWIFSILIMIVWLLAAVSTILSYLAVALLAAEFGATDTVSMLSVSSEELCFWYS